MGESLSAFKDLHVPSKFNFVICLVIFLVAVALLLCGILSPCLAGALIFLGLALCCCAACN